MCYCVYVPHRQRMRESNGKRGVHGHQDNKGEGWYDICVCLQQQRLIKGLRYVVIYYIYFRCIYVCVCWLVGLVYQCVLYA